MKKIICILFIASLITINGCKKENKKVKNTVIKNEQQKKVEDTEIRKEQQESIKDKQAQDRIIVKQPQKKKGSLVIVGDANLTYASYFFILPPNWKPALDENLMQHTHKTGFWRGISGNGKAVVTIMPAKKEKRETIDEFVQNLIEYFMKQPEYESNSMKKYGEFNVPLKYPYKVYKFNYPKGTYTLIVFIDLPTNIIQFNLCGLGNDESCIINYFDDFKNMLTTFEWTLGLNEQEIGKMLEATK